MQVDNVGEGYKDDDSVDSSLIQVPGQYNEYELDGYRRSNVANRRWQWFHLLTSTAITLLSLYCLIIYFVRYDVDTSVYLVSKDKWMIPMIIVMAGMVIFQIVFACQSPKKGWIVKSNNGHNNKLHAEKVLCQLLKLIFPLIIAYEVTVLFTSSQMLKEPILLAEKCDDKEVINNFLIQSNSSHLIDKNIECIPCSHVNHIQVSDFSVLHIILAIAIILNHSTQLSLLVYILETSCDRISSNNQLIRGFAICMFFTNIFLWRPSLAPSFYIEA